MASPEEVLSFWLDEYGPQDWYRSDADFDALVRDRFEATWQAAMQGKFALWLTYPSGALAYCILLDQFPRNMFRGTKKAFSSDRYALAAAKQAIHRGWDLKIDEPARALFYMPLVHSENLCDQDRAVRLMKERLPNGPVYLLHAKAHREIIRMFGRFPSRNEALSRTTSKPESAFAESGGYGSVLRALQATEAA
ncbi:DUF924 family protein [Aestuariicoccus sp. MJ-SS9]|uniref:DUF924 family protein n=1 Tax=Aestuariicoccus sp. MJ-SS9 TaxID=3079855 RepID=UPI002915399B|nr:DUF924 family protein [Aestuariicoccus sp. MJ-SS9]MDU8911034.1 DUF924 family protein [Aestuariicoccus sp. MJ-SS9]